jgi:hypothetical protein
VNLCYLCSIIPFAGSGLLGYATGFALKKILKWMLTCAEHFTRKYSATRHNLTIHNSRGEIVPLLEYLAGRNSGRYQPSRPSLYRRGRGEKRIHNLGHTTATAVADSMGDTFRHRGLQGQYHDYPQHQQQAPSPSIPLPPPSIQPLPPQII